MNKLKAALRYYRLRASWLGDGGQPVSPLQAQARAFRCTLCPLNDDTQSWWERLTTAASSELREQVQLKHSMQLTCDYEDRLHICKGCECLLKLKVWVPISHIAATTDLTELHRENPKCWILEELGK